VLLSSSPAAGHGFVAKVGDFGLVRSLATDAPARLTSNVYGTMGYMPPELLMEGVLSQVGCLGTLDGWASALALVGVQGLRCGGGGCIGCGLLGGGKRVGEVAVASILEKAVTSWQPRRLCVFDTPAGHSSLQLSALGCTAAPCIHPLPRPVVVALQATDVYSFGVLLWEMLTSTRAWAGMSHAAIICQVAVMGRSLELPPGLPPCLHQLLASCLDRDPNNRPGFDQIAQQLQDFVQRYSAGEEREEQPIGTFGCLPGETGEAGTLVFLGCAK
jgi:serine/threonine protein kinase